LSLVAMCENAPHNLKRIILARMHLIMQARAVCICVCVYVCVREREREIKREREKEWI
jgi:hypothetical protein